MSNTAGPRHDRPRDDAAAPPDTARARRPFDPFWPLIAIALLATAAAAYLALTA